MQVIKDVMGEKLVVSVAGRLDTTTAPVLESEMMDALDGIKTLVFDMKDLEYISSAGLRVLLSIQKKMNKVGSMTLKHCNEIVLEVFEVTGFIDIFTVES